MNKKNPALAILSLILGVLSLLLAFSYFLVVGSPFLSVAGMILGIISISRTGSFFSWLSTIINGIAIITFAVIVIMINYGDLKSSKTVYEYYLPKGYSGWTIVTQSVKDAPQIPMRPNSVGGIYRFVFPPSGKIITSSELNDWHSTKYFWYDAHDTISFEAEQGNWGDTNFRSLIHCEGADAGKNYFFYVSDIPRNPQDPVVLEACEHLPDTK